MDIESIKKLIYMIDKSNICVFKLDMNNCEIYMSKRESKNNKHSKSQKKLEAQNEICCTCNSDVSVSKLYKDNKIKNTTTIKSELVGVFYNYMPYKFNYQLKIESEVKKGQILGVIMYLNIPMEVKSDVDGKILSIYVENGQMVEYGQELFNIRF